MMNRNLEKRQNEESVSRSSEKRFQQVNVQFQNPLGDGESKLAKLLTLGVDGFGRPQNNFGLILRTQARVHGVRGKWLRKNPTEESWCQSNLEMKKNAFPPVQQGSRKP